MLFCVERSGQLFLGSTNAFCEEDVAKPFGAEVFLAPFTVQVMSSLSDIQLFSVNKISSRVSVE